MGDQPDTADLEDSIGVCCAVIWDGPVPQRTSGMTLTKLTGERECDAIASMDFSAHCLGPMCLPCHMMRGCQMKLSSAQSCRISVGCQVRTVW